MNRCITMTVIWTSVAVACAQTNANKTSVDKSHFASTKLQATELQGTAPVMFATLLVQAGMPGGVAISDQE